MHCKITRESTQESLVFHTKAKQNNYKEENKDALFFEHISLGEV